MVSQDLLERKPDAARKRLDSSLAESPKSSPLLVLAANTYGTIGDMQKAESTYEALLQVDPTNIEAFSKLGLLYHSQGRLEEAKNKYESLARHQDRPVTALTLLGMIFELQKNTKEARARYQRALDFEPKAAVAANNLAWIYAETGDSLDMALQLAQSAKSGLPDNPQVNDTLGWIYYKKGMASLAVTFLEEGTRKGPPNPDTLFRLGLAYLKTGDKKNAQASFEQALKLNPQFQEAEQARQALKTIKG